MAITLNKQAILCEETAIASGKITADSSPQTLLYGISREWRGLLAATDYPCEKQPGWSEKEVGASEVITATLAYLQHLGCRDIEQLIRDTVKRQARLR